MSQLWPYALKYTTELHNNLPSATKPAPLDILSRASQSSIAHMHTFGCPCFVLQDKLCTGLDKLNRWDTRSTKGIFLGKSQHHANSASIVLNLDTGRVTTQQRVVFDDHFSTVAPTCNMNEIWPELVSKRIQIATFDIPVKISEGIGNC